MPNPYSSQGISDRDYAAAIAAMSGEMSPNAQQADVDMIMDSIVNRAWESGQRTREGYRPASLSSVVTASGQYDAMRGVAGNRDRGSRRTSGGQQAAREAFRAALTPSRAAPEIRDRINTARQAIENVLVTGTSRGIAQGATNYRNVEVTDAWGTGRGHRRDERDYGFVDDTTGHRFSGMGMWQDREFDPVSLHGSLTPPDLPGALTGFDTPDFSDVTANLYGDPRLSAPDLPGALSGLDQFGPSMDEMGGNYPDITSGLYGDPRLSAPDLPGAVDIPGASYPDITSGLYGAPQAAAPDLPGALSGLDAYGPTRDEMGIAPTGHYAGFDGSIPTPDFAAPSLNERQQMQAVSDRVTSHPFDADIGALNAGLMAELAPSAPLSFSVAPSSFSAIPQQDAPLTIGPHAYDMNVVPGFRDFFTPVAQKDMLPDRQALREMQPPRPQAAPVRALPETSIPTSSAQQSAQPAGPYAGYSDPMDVMGAIAQGRQEMPEGFNKAWGSTAFGDGPYAVSAFDDLRNEVARGMGKPTTTSLYDSYQENVPSPVKEAIKGAILGGLMGGPVGALTQGAAGFAKEALLPNGILGAMGVNNGRGLVNGSLLNTIGLPNHRDIARQALAQIGFHGGVKGWQPSFGLSPTAPGYGVHNGIDSSGAPNDGSGHQFGGWDFRDPTMSADQFGSFGLNGVSGDFNSGFTGGLLGETHDPSQDGGARYQ
jgi:hypothetical protein